jgi:gamma-glutamyltranspeptidase/glutathione hydrolase
MNPQEALDAPRFELTDPYNGSRAVALEHDSATIAGLSALGHQATPGSSGFGGGQIIVVDENGVRHGGSDKRKDGCVVAY